MLAQRVQAVFHDLHGESRRVRCEVSAVAFDLDC